MHKLYARQATVPCALAIVVAMALACKSDWRPPRPTAPGWPSQAARQEPTASASPSPDEGQATVTPTAERQEAVATLASESAMVHGLVFESSAGLEVFSEGRRSTVVTWSELHVPPGRVLGLSADGRKLAYTRTEQDLWLADLAAGGSIPLVEGPIRARYADVLSIAWSADAAWLALRLGERYGDRPHPDAETLFTVEVATGKVHEIASGMADFCWVGQSGEVAYLNIGGEEDGVFLVRPDGTGRRCLYQVSGSGYYEPFLGSSPRDGILVLVVGSLAYDEQSLLAINPRDGSSPDLLRGYGGPDLDPRWPVWSPDGAQVAFLNGSGGDLYVVDAASGQVKLCGGRFRGPLAWSPDSATLAAADDYDRTYCLIGVRDGGTLQRLGIEGYSLGVLEWR